MFAYHLNSIFQFLVHFFQPPGTAKFAKNVYATVVVVSAILNGKGHFFCPTLSQNLAVREKERGRTEPLPILKLDASGSFLFLF